MYIGPVLKYYLFSKVGQFNMKIVFPIRNTHVAYQGSSSKPMANGKVCYFISTVGQPSLALYFSMTEKVLPQRVHM